MAMDSELEIPGDCEYLGPPDLIPPNGPTPRHTLYLSNLDDQRFLRFSIKYLYVFPASGAIPIPTLKAALAAALVEYYPLAGRLKPSEEEEGKLVVECNAEGALFAEAALPGIAAADFRGARPPHKSWRKLLYRVDSNGFVDVPPLVVQVTHLGCGGMVLCTAINHCLCDGIGTAHFLHAWARAAAARGISPVSGIAIVHDRRALRPRRPPLIAFTHPEYSNGNADAAGIAHLLGGQPLSPVSLTFTASHLAHLKNQLLTSPFSPSSPAPALKRCTSFEALAAAVWRAWVRALDPSPSPSSLPVKLLFSVNVRNRLTPELPAGFYGNGFVLGCAESTAAQLTASDSMAATVRLVQGAKDSVDDAYVRSMVDLLEADRGRKPDLAASLVISAWTRLGLEELDFGNGAPLHMGPLTSEIYCVFVPVAGDPRGVSVLVSVPLAAADRFRHYCCHPCGVEDGGGAMADMLEKGEKPQQQHACLGQGIKMDC